MEVNEAPEKIYVHVRANSELGTTWHSTWIGVNDIEYARTNALIEKAVEWWMDNFAYTDDVDIKYKTIEDFKNYMKGE